MKPTSKKAKSKRVTLRMKYKIQRKVREHNRKQRRDERLKGKSKLKKDPGIPKLHPFKHEILQEVEEAKERVIQDKERRKQQRLQKANEKRKIDLAEFAAEAQQRTATYEALNALDKKTGTLDVYHETSRKAFYREFKKVIEAADVILQVLDARDPMGCRSAHVEEAVRSAGGNKRLVLVLNKIDLVPKEAVEQWLTYLRHECPTIAFKASTQSQKSHISQSRSKSLDNTSDSACHGAGVLMKLLGNYCRNLNIRTTIRVGVVGYPNVGKSSIINSLKRSRACGVGSTPGFTKNVQEVALDKHIKLLDSPGIVFASSKDASLVLRNCVKIETLEDAVEPVEQILKRCDQSQIMEHYEVASFSTGLEFLQILARKLGKLKKGGIPDVNAAGKVVLQDWTNGNISYYTKPPQKKHESHVASTVVSQMSEAFDIDALLGEESEILSTLRSEEDYDGAVAMETSDMPQTQISVEETMEEAEDEPEESQVVTFMKSKKPKTQTNGSSSVAINSDPLNPQTNQARKKSTKKQSKQQQPSSGEDYDFGQDFVAMSTYDEDDSEDDGDFVVEEQSDDEDDDEMAPEIDDSDSDL